MNTQTRTKKLLLKRVVLVLSACAVALLSAEVAVRIVRPSYYVNVPASYEYDPELAFRLRPGSHLYKTTDYQQESKVNSLGTTNFQEDFDEYESLVFTVGDSYTQGTGLPADSSYPFQLDMMLNMDDEGFYTKRFGVVNLGVGGYGGEQSLISLRRWAARLRPPAFVLYLGCDNDLEDDLMFSGGHRHTRVVAGRPFWGRLTTPMRWLTEDVQLLIKARRFLFERTRARLRADATEKMAVDGKVLSVAEFESPAWEKLLNYAKEHNSVLVVSWSEEGASYAGLKSWADERGVAFADWAPKAKSVRAAMPALPLENNHSGGHYRAWVNRVIAEEFARQMRARQR